MKQLRIIIAALSLCLFMFGSCNKNDSQYGNGSTEYVIMQGKWAISSYHNNSNDVTAEYKNYRFTFAKGVVTATNDSLTVKGTWITTINNNQNILVLSFGSNGPFSELTDDWHIIQTTDNAVQLEDVTSSNAPEQLSFQQL